MRNSMRKSTGCMLLAAALAAGVAYGRLPPPTPEEQAAAAAKKAKQKQQIEQEKAELERAQDRVAGRYRREKGGVKTPTTARPTAESLPKPATELPRDVGPRPGQPSTGEAHSAPAR